jgi:folate-dependent tRNA-U54 methylase TrmFO/GidA
VLTELSDTLRDQNAKLIATREVAALTAGGASALDGDAISEAVIKYIEEIERLKYVLTTCVLFIRL